MADHPTELVCRVRTAKVPADTNHLTELLDRVELDRRGRYRDDDDRHRFTAGAALARLTVADHTGWNAAGVPIERACEDCGRPHGRPRIDAGSGPPFDVSVTHAGSFVAVAIVEGSRVGIDIDVVPAHFRDLVDAAAHPDERPGLTTARRFAVTWVRKEALLKAHGAGLRIDPSAFVVPEPTGAPSHVRLPGEPMLAYRMLDVDVDSEHVGAVAVLTATRVRFVIDDATVVLATDA